MNVEAFLICDHAVINNGKPVISGAFDTVLAPSLPVRIASFACFARLRYQKEDEGEHNIAVCFIDGDGRALTTPFNQDTTVLVPPYVDSIAGHLLLEVSNLNLFTLGAYSVDLFWDGSICARLPLTVLAADPVDAVA